MRISYAGKYIWAGVHHRNHTCHYQCSSRVYDDTPLWYLKDVHLQIHTSKDDATGGCNMVGNIKATYRNTIPSMVFLSVPTDSCTPIAS